MIIIIYMYCINISLPQYRYSGKLNVRTFIGYGKKYYHKFTSIDINKMPMQPTP